MTRHNDRDSPWALNAKGAARVARTRSIALAIGHHVLDYVPSLGNDWQLVNAMEREPALLRGSILAAAALLLGAAIGLVAIGVARFEASVINLTAPALSSHGLLPVAVTAVLLAACWRVILFIADRFVSGALVRLFGPLLVFLAALATSDAWALYAVFPGAAIALFVEAAWHFVDARA